MKVTINKRIFKDNYEKNTFRVREDGIGNSTRMFLRSMLYGIKLSGNFLLDFEKNLFYTIEERNLHSKTTILARMIAGFSGGGICP